MGARTRGGLGTPHPQFGAAARRDCGASFPSPSVGAPHITSRAPLPTLPCTASPPPISFTPPFASFDRHAGAGLRQPPGGVGSGVLVRLARAPCHLPDLHPFHSHAPRPTIPTVALRNNCAQASLDLVSGAERSRHLQAQLPARPTMVRFFFLFFHGWSPSHYYGIYMCYLCEIFSVVAVLT